LLLLIYPKLFYITVFFLEVVQYAALGRGRVLFVNERRYASLVVADIAASVGEAYVMGR